MRPVTLGLRASACVALLAAAMPAHAQARVEADRLFREGKAALEAHRYGEACEKLSQSQRLDPATGTLLALALCHEASGKSATAWREYLQVVDAATRDGRSDRVKLAREKVAALEPNLAHAVIDVSRVQSLPELAIDCDGTPVPHEDYGRPLALDPGDHVVTVTARDKTRYRGNIAVRASETTTLAVPALEDASQPTTAPSANSGGGTRRTIAWSLVGTGAAGLLLGTVFGVRAVILSDDAKTRCPSSPCSDLAAVGENGDAQTSAWVANFAIGIGLVAGGVGAALLLIHPHAPNATGIRVTPTLSASGGGALLEGTF